MSVIAHSVIKKNLQAPEFEIVQVCLAGCKFMYMGQTGWALLLLRKKSRIPTFGEYGIFLLIGYEFIQILVCPIGPFCMGRSIRHANDQPTMASIMEKKVKKNVWHFHFFIFLGKILHLLSCLCLCAVIDF